MITQTQRSGEHHVLLTNISQATTGRFRCEVSEERPMFATDTAFGDLLVVVLPRHGPTLEGSPERGLSVDAQFCDIFYKKHIHRIHRTKP